MKKLIATLLLLMMTLAIPGGAYPQVDSVVPLIGPDGVVHCAAFVIDQKRHYILTADHCIDDTHALLADGIQTTEIFHVPALDAAVLYAPGLLPYRKELNARVEIAAEEKATFYGYGLGIFTTQEGSIVFPIIRFGDGFTAYTLTAPAIMPGMSGGPAISQEDGLVVGMNQRTHIKFNLALNAAFYQIVGATKEYWGSD